MGELETNRSPHSFTLGLTFDLIFSSMESKVECHLKAHCHGADWINKTIKRKRIRPGSVISLYSEIHEDDNYLIPFILKTKDDPRA